MRNRYLLASATILLLIILPNLIAQGITDPGHVFGGFLLNPTDGNSYLAKIQQGWQGRWSFQLPYSAEPNQGAFLFLFYLFLGHIARWSGLSSVLIFHLARVVAATFLLWELKSFFSLIFKDRPRVAFWAFLFAGLGSGLGWLAAFAGGFTSDFWVAEAYPFLSMYSSPHFSLGIAILLWFLSQTDKPCRKRDIPFLAVVGILLGIIFPFGVAVAGVILLGAVAYDLFTKQTVRWQTPFVFLFTGGLTILYQFIVIRTDPILAIWDRQNQTPTPALWDFGISFLPLLALAIFGGVQSIRHHNRRVVLLTGWLILGAILIYLPFNLQRRFLFGYMIPVAGLAAYGLAELKTKRKTLLGIAAIGLTLPTLLIIVAGGVSAVRNNEPSMVLQKSERISLDYLAQISQPDDLVLASPESGLFIPAYTGRRVIYGHPFETVDAQVEKLAVEEFFSGPVDDAALDWARERGVHWIWWGPREDAYGRLPTDLPAGLKLVYEDEGIRLFELEDQP